MSIVVNPAILQDSSLYAKKISASVGLCASAVSSIRMSLSSEISNGSGIGSSLYGLTEELYEAQRDIEEISRFLDYAGNSYLNVERRLSAATGLKPATGLSSVAAVKPPVFNSFVEEFKANFGIKELLSGTNYINKIYSFYRGFKEGKILSTSYQVYNFLGDASKTYRNYMKIGNAVGTKKAMAWWLKKITGLDTPRRVSTAKNVFVRFKNNLTNKTSPYNLKTHFKDVGGDLAFKNGTGKAIASWSGIAVSGYLNLKDNLREQAESNGQMSNSRMIAETLTETGVDTALSIGAGVVVGAAVTALSPVALPTAAIAVGGAIVITGINAGVRAITGKTATEWISDTVLDLGSNIGKGLGSAAKYAVTTVAKWFKW